MLIVALLCIIAIAGADQLIKSYLVDKFILQEEYPFLQIGDLDIMHLRYVENEGSAFSSFQGMRIPLLIFTAVCMAVCVYILIFRTHKGRPLLLYWSLIMIVGGGLGNMVDRIFRKGAVIDYLDVQLFDFAVFNFADCFVTVGTALLFIYIAFFMDKKSNQESEEKKEETADDECHKKA